MSNLGVASSSLAMGGGSLVPTLTFLVIYFKIVRIGQKERFQERFQGRKNGLKEDILM